MEDLQQLSVLDYRPLQQGLRPMDTCRSAKLPPVLDYRPLQQGLRQITSAAN